MRMSCDDCGKSIDPNVTDAYHTVKEKDRKLNLCTDCYAKLLKQYDSKETCNKCLHFSKDNNFCKKLKKEKTHPSLEIDPLWKYYLTDDCAYYATNELRWKCKECGHIFVSPEPPRECPVCGPEFPDFQQDQKKPNTETLEESPARGSSEISMASLSKNKIFVYLVIFALVLVPVASLWWYNYNITRTYNIAGTSTVTFTFRISSDTEWQGSFGTEEGQASRSGSGNAVFTCHGSIASAAVQKTTDWGYLRVEIVKNGQVVASQSTDASYGVVTVFASS